MTVKREPIWSHRERRRQPKAEQVAYKAGFLAPMKSPRFRRITNPTALWRPDASRIWLGR